MANKTDAHSNRDEVNKEAYLKVKEEAHQKDRAHQKDIALRWCKRERWNEEQFIILCIFEHKSTLLTPGLRSYLERMGKTSLDYDVDLAIQKNITDIVVPYYELLIEPIFEAVRETEYEKHKDGAAPIWWIEQANNTVAGIHVPEWLKEAVFSTQKPTTQNCEGITDKPTSIMESNAIHKIRNRTYILNAEIDEAIKLAVDKTDPSSVWAEFVKMAEKKIGCLIGVDERTIKYQDGETVKFFKKRSFIERFNRKTKHAKTQ